MFKLYRFSPIQDKAHLLEAVAYVVEQSNLLCKRVTGEQLPMTYLTICAHYDDEYARLVSIVDKLGKVGPANNGVSAMLARPIETGGQRVPKLRIRKPDPYRTQVGCNDFDPGDYNAFKQKYLAKHPHNLRHIKRPEYEMIEFFDPDFDVFAYVVSKS